MMMHPTDTEKKNVLIVEDDADLREALHDKLVLKGFVPVDARTGEEGLQFALRDKPDLILLDILMPVMDGLVMIKKLRETGAWGKQVPVIFLTNLTADTAEVRNAVAEGVPTQYLIKSDWTIDQVVEKVKEALLV